MSQSSVPKSSFPSDVQAISKSVASSLQMLDEVQFRRLHATAQLAEDIMNSMIELVERANQLSSGPHDFKTLKLEADDAKAKAKIANDEAERSAKEQLAVVTEKSTELAEGSLELSASHALSMAFENAVVSQQQVNILSQAVLTQGIQSLYSVVPAATGLNESERISDTASKKSSPRSKKS